MASAKEIPPGGEGKIDTTFRTGRRPGPTRKSIRVMTNDPKNAEVKLELKAELVVMFAPKNPRLYFGQVNRSTTINKSIEFTGEKLPEIKITNIKLDDENLNAFDFKIEDKRESGEDFLAISIDLDTSKLDPGRFNHKLIVSTDDKEIQELTILLSGEILGPLKANPRRLYFVNFVPEERMEREVRISSPEDLKFDILEVNVPDDDIEVVEFNKDQKGEHVIKLALNAPKNRNRIKTEMVVKTSLENHSTITVPIYAYEKRNRNSPTSKENSPQSINRKSLKKERFEKFTKNGNLVDKRKK